MIEKLNALLDRYMELDEAIAQPDIICDYEKYQQLLKERAAIQPLAEKYKQYLAVWQVHFVCCVNASRTNSYD